ncbi:hypothetical protein JMJ35_010527 [Cladonia borealis]|uniref:Uncharacterized protein n=1 Tax=Cladonia borealis TaxID=184061 RepID=A0AA39QRG5_9LECA|nr:hypothetical protein JMJ35_010527 [Cladonia borealis]
MSNQHRYNTRSSAARGNPSQNRMDNHQHDPGFDHSSPSRSSERSAVSSYNSSGQDVLHPHDTLHDRRNNHDESNSRDNTDPSPTRDNNQDLRPDANAPFGYRLDVSGKKRPAPDDPNQLCLVRERNGAHTDKTRREIEDLSGYWSITPNGTRYFHRTTPFEDLL